MENAKLIQAFEELAIEQETSPKLKESSGLEAESTDGKKKLLTTIMDEGRNMRKRCSNVAGTSSAKRNSSGMAFIANEYEKAESCASMLRKETALFFDDTNINHNCTWDLNYIENPRRYTAIMERCKEKKLLERCVDLPYKMATKEDILKVHTSELYEKLQNLSEIDNPSELEQIASNYDAVYFNKHTFKASLIAAGCAISLVESVGIGEVQNGIAIIRPPGHHAMTNEYCGFCFFNNVAIAAQYALDNQMATKILIVDVDVHHGQATQRKFYDTDQVLYFSIHRYENGAFWPHLRESDFDYVGEGKGKGYNINFPLNATKLNDSDYLSIVFNVLLPVAYEFNPDLIIVSAGYDACIGCPEGEMMVTPAFYGHLITLLSGLANGKIAVCLEGGYFLPSLAEGVVMTLKALLGDACASLQPITKPHKSVIDTINNLRIVLRDNWNCFQMFEVTDKLDNNPHVISTIFNGQDMRPPYPTRNCYPVNAEEHINKYNDMITKLRQGYESMGTTNFVGCCYDENMLLHHSKDHVEAPARLQTIYDIYTKWNLLSRCINLDTSPIDLTILKTVHDDAYVNLIINKQFGDLLDEARDMYFNENTYDAIIKANECLIAVVDSVISGCCRSGAALIRPPGHHAEPGSASGFCFLNNVAIAAKHILNKYSVKRVLILDFDIHHGNGTQNIFYDSNQVMYLSIHKYFPRSFFPASTEGHSRKSGRRAGLGYNINITLTETNAYNQDYLTIFFNVILPILYSFAPEIILVSAGFDAGINDPIGHYSVTPECFGHFIQLIKPLANGKIVLALEGGYNYTTVKYSMNICIKTLLGDPLPMLNSRNSISKRIFNTITAVKQVHQQYWPVLDIDRTLYCPK